MEREEIRKLKKQHLVSTLIFKLTERFGKILKYNGYFIVPEYREGKIIPSLVVLKIEQNEIYYVSLIEFCENKDQEQEREKLQVLMSSRNLREGYLINNDTGKLFSVLVNTKKEEEIGLLFGLSFTTIIKEVNMFFGDGKYSEEQTLNIKIEQTISIKTSKK